MDDDVAEECTPIPGTECEEFTATTTCSLTPRQLNGGDVVDGTGTCTVATGSGSCSYTAPAVSGDGSCAVASGTGSCTYTPSETPISNYKIACFLQLMTTLLLFGVFAALQESGKLSEKVPAKAGAVMGGCGILLSMVSVVLICTGDDTLDDALSAPKMTQGMLGGRLSGNAEVQSTIDDLGTITYLSFIWLVLFGLQTLCAFMSCAALAETTAFDPISMNKRYERRHS